MSFDYTYKVVSVDDQFGVMEIEYTSPNRETIHISARLPYADQTVESVIQLNAPIAYWLEKEKTYANVFVGISGAVGDLTPTPTVASTKLSRIAELAAWRYGQEVGGITLTNGAKIATDRESQAQLTSAFSSLQNGLVTSIDWKASDGNWVTLGLPEVTAIATAVANHVQTLFTKEKTLTALINSKTTINQIKNVVFE